MNQSPTTYAELDAANKTDGHYLRLSERNNRIIDDLFQDYLVAYRLYMTYCENVEEGDPDHAAKLQYFFDDVEEARARYEQAGGTCTLDELMNQPIDNEMEE